MFVFELLELVSQIGEQLLIALVEELVLQSSRTTGKGILRRGFHGVVPDLGGRDRGDREPLTQAKRQYLAQRL
jgi:hypothetical protein